jgi:SagB-type dehydrogenase family enzyme
MVDALEAHRLTDNVPDRMEEMYGYPERDPDDDPRLWKVYRDLPRDPLDRVARPMAPALPVVAEADPDPLAGTEQPAPDGFDRTALATLLRESAGVLRAVEHDEGTARYRAASCTGKRYHVEVYAVCGGVAGLADGVYHFDPDGFGLDVLRAGDHRAAVADAADSPAVAEAPVTVVATSAWWRNAYNYHERTYRHAFWDAGTVLANLLAAAHARDHRASLLAGFADDPVVELLGLAPAEEAPVALAPVGADAPAPASQAAVDPIEPSTEPYSPTSNVPDLIVDAWRASRLPAGEAGDWRERARAANGVGRSPAGDGERVSLSPVDHATATERPLSNAVRRRRSCREYADAPLSRRKLGTVLDRATRAVPAGWCSEGAARPAFVDAYVLTAGVEGVDDAAWQFHPEAAELERLRDSSAADQTDLALEQEWAGDAHANVYLMADVEAIVERLGDRGYRLAQLEAGVVLGRLYLATYAHGSLGGTGLTFEDRAVTEFLSPRAADQAPMTMFAMGVADDR